MLNVPYVAQINSYSCGPAALEMVYRYLNPDCSFSQASMSFEKGELVPGAENYKQIRGDALVEAARTRGLFAGVGRVSRDRTKRLEQIKYFIETERIPLIACQMFTEAMPHLGHFRVLIDVHEKGVVLHDPDRKRGGEAMQWGGGKLEKFWKHTGNSVTGGVAIWIADRELKDVLDPLIPNAWAPH